MPNISTDYTAWICSKAITNLTSELFDLHLSSIVALNLAGFKIILLKSNYLIAALHSDSNVGFKLSTVGAMLLKL